MVESVQSARSSVVESTYFGIALSCPRTAVEPAPERGHRLVGDAPEQEDLRRQRLVELVALARLSGLEVEDPALVRMVADVARSRGLDDAVE
jgi:hypothetical protein